MIYDYGGIVNCGLDIDRWMGLGRLVLFDMMLADLVIVLSI